MGEGEKRGRGAPKKSDDQLLAEAAEFMAADRDEKLTRLHRRALQRAGKGPRNNRDHFGRKLASAWEAQLRLAIPNIEAFDRLEAARAEYAQTTAALETAYRAWELAKSRPGEGKALAAHKLRDAHERDKAAKVKLAAAGEALPPGDEIQVRKALHVVRCEAASLGVASLKSYDRYSEANPDGVTNESGGRQFVAIMTAFEVQPDGSQKPLPIGPAKPPPRPFGTLANPEIPDDLQDHVEDAPPIRLWRETVTSEMPRDLQDKLARPYPTDRAKNEVEFRLVRQLNEAARPMLEKLAQGYSIDAIDTDGTITWRAPAGEISPEK